MAEERLWIKDLRPGTEVEEEFAVRTSDLRQRRNGGDYLALTLSDRTGHVAGLVWDDAKRLARLCEPGRVVRIRGQVQRYNQRLQVVVRDATVVEQDEIDESVFVRASSVDPELLWRGVLDLIEAVGDDRLRQLLFRIFSDPEIVEPFKRAAAARTMHHAFRAGLLEHTLSMTRVGKTLAQHYRLDEDMVVAGALLHDLGKVWELELGATIEYTDDGRLLGHLPMEVLYVDRRISELEGFPAETRRQLLHILLSHHGEYEYGSPRRPKTPEALLVHMVDNLDSKVNGMLEIMSEGGETEGAWTPYSPILQRFVYRRRPPSSEQQDSNDS